MDVRVLVILDSQDEYIAPLSQRNIISILSKTMFHLWCNSFTYIEAIFVVNKNRYAIERVVLELIMLCNKLRIIALNIIVVEQHGLNRSKFMGIPL